MLAQLRRRRADGAGRAGEPRHDVVHGKLAHVRVGIIGDQLALDHVRVLENLRDVVDRPDGHLGLFEVGDVLADRKSTRLNSSHGYNSYAVFCLKKKKKKKK